MNQLLKAVLLSFICTFNVFASDVTQLLNGRGIWVNNPSKLGVEEIEFLKSIGVQRVHFMLTDDLTKFKDCTGATVPKRIVDQASLAKVIKLASSENLKVIVTTYVPPAKNVIDKMLDPNSLLANAIKENALEGVEYDLEGKWADSRPCGFRNHQEAIKYLLNKTRELRVGLPIGVTTHPGHLNSPKIGIDMFDWIAVQAYSKCPLIECAEHVKDIPQPAKNDEKAMKIYNEAVDRAWDNPRNQPGVMQKKIAERLKDAKNLVIIGLPAYQQYWNKNHTVDEAMARAHEAAIQLQKEHSNYVGVNYWALSNVISTKARPEIATFLKASAIQ